MQDQDKTKDQLIEELNEMRIRVARLEDTQNAFKDPESQYCEIIDSLNEAAYVIQDGMIQYANQILLELSGYSIEESLSAKAVEDFVHPHDREMVEQHHKRRMQGDISPYRYKFRAIFKDGSQKWLEMKSSLIMWKGRPAGLAVLVDISDRKQMEQALRESEDKYRNFFETSRDCVFITTVDGKFIDFNDLGFEMLGYDPSDKESLLRLDVSTLYANPEDRQEHISIVIDAGFCKDYPVDLRKRDGSIIHTLITTVCRRDHQGNVIGFQGTIRDVTDLKRSEERLRESEEKYRLLFTNSPVGTMHFDFKGLITDCNQKLLDILGAGKKEVIGFDLTTSPTHNLLRDAAMSAILGKMGMCEGEYTSVNGGKTVWCKIVYSPLINSEGLTLGGIALVEDLTVQKQAEAALRLSEEKFSKAFQASPDAILISRMSDGQLVEVNEGFSRITGYSKDEALGNSTIVLNLWADPKDREKVVATLLDTKMIRDLEVRFRTKSGKIIDGLYSGDMIFFAGEAHILSVVRDITERNRWELELQNTLKRFYTILSNSFAGLLLVTNEGVVEFVNQAMCSLFDIDVPPESLTGTAAPEMIGMILGSYEDPEGTLARIKDLVAQNKPVRGAEVAVCGGRTYLVDYVPIVMDGQPYGRLWHHTDITERKQTEDELRMKTQLLNERVKELNCLFAISRIIEDSQESLDRIFQGVIDLIPPSWQYPEITCARVIVQNKEFRTENYNVPVSTQSATITVHGQTIGSLEVGYVKDAPESDEGAFLKEERHLLNSISERLGRIIERKQAENAVRESEDKYRRIVDTAREGIWAMNGARVTTFVNGMMAQMLGYAVEDMIGKKVEHFMFPEDLEDHQGKMEARRQGQHGFYERRFRCADGTPLWTRVSATSVMGAEGEFLGSIAMFTDISQVKSLQSQLLQSQKMEAVGTLAAGIAHDFNNMLQSILGYSDLLLDGKTRGEPGYQELERIVKTSLEARDLVQKIRLFSRKADIQPVAVDLNHQLTELTKFLSHTLLKTINVNVHLGENLDLINADPALMDQMVTNLAINASEAMPDGGRLTIETQNILLDDEFCKSHAGAKPGHHVILTISDTGRGMSKDLLERLFDPFFSTKQRDYHRGTGLGLSIVKGIVDEHSGYITVDSEVGKGTTFKIYFPILAVQHKPQVQIDTKIEATTDGTETILLVEDEELVRDLGIRLLERFGYKVIAVRDGQKAVEVYAKEQHNISLVILDIVMPRMDGKECLQELLKINPGVKVIISSGVAQDDRVKEVVDLGAKGFLLKPYGMKVLQEKVRDILGSQ